MAQAIAFGARIIEIDGNFDDALKAAIEITSQGPIGLVNSVNPNRIEGQKTAAFEICEALGDAPDILAIPVGNAGISPPTGARHAGCGERSRRASPVDVGLPGRQRGAHRPRRACGRTRDDRYSDPHRHPRQLEGRYRGPETSPAVSSKRLPTTRSSKPTASSPGAKAFSSSPRALLPWQVC